MIKRFEDGTLVAGQAYDAPVVPYSTAFHSAVKYDRVMRAIVALHRLALDGPVEYCVQDGKPWPCRTVVATSAIEYAKAHPELDYRPKGGAA